MKLRIAITGAGGFLGTALSRRLLAHGAEIVALARSEPGLPGVRWLAYDLAATSLPTGCFEDVDAVVHTAFAMGRAGDELEQLNVSAALRLRDACREGRRHFVFISSMSAHADATSSYGRAKWMIEQQLDPRIDAIVRPGLIVGPGGLYARMLQSLRRAPVVPVFFGGTQPIQPIALSDLVDGLEQILVRRLTGEFNLGLPEPIPVRALYSQMLAAAHLRRPLVSLPGGMTLQALRLSERLGLRLPITSENLRGQQQLRAFPTAKSFARLGLPHKSLAELDWSGTLSPP